MSKLLAVRSIRLVTGLTVALLLLASVGVIAENNASASTSVTGDVKQTIGNNNLLLYVSDVKVSESATVKIVRVSLIFKNLDFKPQLFNQFFMEMKDSKGREYSPELDSTLPSAYIPSLDIARGTATFEIPASASPSKFYYSKFFESDLIVDLTKTKSEPDEPPKSDWMYSSNEGFKADDGETEITINNERYSGQYYIIDITVRNIGEDEISYNPFYASVKDSNGNVYSHDFFVDLDTRLSSGDLSSNDFVRGELAFEVGSRPSDGLMFIWQESINSGTLTKPLPESDEDDGSDVDGGFVGNTISGKYSDPNTGLEIQFPDGWTGISFLGIPAVSPNGIDHLSTEFTGARMSILTVNRELIQNLFQEDGCERSYSYVKLQTIEAIQVRMECNSDDSYSKSKGYVLMTDSKAIIVGFKTDSSQNYDRYAPEFDKSVGTLKVSNAVKVKNALSATLGLKAESHKVTAKGNQVELKIESNSKVSNFAFNENSKSVSFRVEGDEGTRGFTTLNIAKVLESPYTVTIDGQATTDFISVEDTINGENTILINYEHSVHDIAITGTNVVPEFPIHLILIVASLIGVTIVLSRARWQLGYRSAS